MEKREHTESDIVERLTAKGMNRLSAFECLHILTSVNNFGGEIHLSVLKEDLRERGHIMEYSDLLSYVRSLEAFGYLHYAPEKLKYNLTPKGIIG
jgi:hypothetical protein